MPRERGIGSGISCIDRLVEPPPSPPPTDGAEVELFKAPSGALGSGWLGIAEPDGELGKEAELGGDWGASDSLGKAGGCNRAVAGPPSNEEGLGIALAS